MWKIFHIVFVKKISNNLHIFPIYKDLIKKMLSNTFSKLLGLLSEQRVIAPDHLSLRELWYYFLGVIIQIGYQRQQPVWAAGMSVDGPHSVRMNTVFDLEEGAPVKGDRIGTRQSLRYLTTQIILWFFDLGLLCQKLCTSKIY